MVDPMVFGKMYTGRNSKKDKLIGDVEVTLTRNTETLDVDGERFPHPRVELRLRINVKRDGKIVAFSQIPVAAIAEGIESFMSEQWMWERQDAS